MVLEEDKSKVSVIHVGPCRCFHSVTDDDDDDDVVLLFPKSNIPAECFLRAL